jgi:serine/threonine-protein kinase
MPESQGKMAGEYRLGRKLGEGGFGTVYEAEHPLLKRKAAVKVLHRAAGLNSDAVLRFVSEAQAANQVRNRHIVDVFSFGKLTDGRHFFVMDLLDGEPLDRFLKREGRLEPATVLQLLRPIASALDTAHAAGIVHRDLKPQNIFLAWEMNGETVPKLLDFGMAKLLGDSTVNTASGTPVGTPLYMSPEQARGESVDGRADIYALGVVCHELLTGRPPILGESTVAVLMAQIVQAPMRVSEACPDLSPELDLPVLAMLAKSAQERPATATLALDALEASLKGLGIAVPSGLPHLTRPTDSERMLRSDVWRDVLGEQTTQYEGSTPTKTRRLGRGKAIWAAALASGALGLYALRGTHEAQAPSAGAASQAVLASSLPGPRALPTNDSRAALTASAQEPSVAAAFPSSSGVAPPASASRQGAAKRAEDPSQKRPVAAHPSATGEHPAPAKGSAPAGASEAVPHDLESPF